jgi:5-methylcytosine-specific restriction enzyme A
MPSATPDRPWLPWYDKARWKNRRNLQLQMHPLCAMCLEHSVVMAAEVADHIEPHHGNAQLFWYGPLQSLCTHHHNASKQQLETKGFVDDIGTDGFPVDPNHPFCKLDKNKK